MTNWELQNILNLHIKWVNGQSDGKRADLSHANLDNANLDNANLCGADLRGAYLSHANLDNANLCGAYLRDANLCGANLRGANLYDADLRDTDLRGAYLSHANLDNANLCGADLRGAYLSHANLDNAKNVPFIPMACPDTGSYIAYKTARGYIVVLKILEDALRSSATGRKCRASKAEVLEIENLDGSYSNIKSVRSNYDINFIYNVGEIVEVPDFDTNRWNECAPGIHHFISRQEAVNYNNF